MIVSKDKTLYCKEWAKAELVQVSDMFKGNGEMFCFKELNHDLFIQLMLAYNKSRENAIPTLWINCKNNTITSHLICFRLYTTL